MVEIIEGKLYRTRDGRKVGPMLWNFNVQNYPWAGQINGRIGVWATDGHFYKDGPDSPADLVAEWTDEPTKPELPRFDVEKLVDIWEAEHESDFKVYLDEHRRALLAVANYARDITLNPPKDPVEVLAEKLRNLRNRAYGEGAPSYSEAVARHILETYPDAAEKL